jgi:hypothetical protein
MVLVRVKIRVRFVVRGYVFLVEVRVWARA